MGSPGADLFNQVSGTNPSIPTYSPKVAAASPGASLFHSVSPTPPTTAAPSTHHGGFLSTVEHIGHDVVHNPATHIAAKTAVGLDSDIEHLPAGVFKFGKDAITPSHVQGAPSLGKQWADLFEHGKLDTLHTDPLAKDLGAMKGSTIKSITDPHYMAEHPDQVVLNALALASGGAAVAGRVADAGKILSAADEAGAGSKLARAGKALVTKPAPVTRLISHDGMTTELPAASNPLTRTVQRATDQLRERFPDVPLVGAAKVVSRANAQEMAAAEKYARVPVDTMVTKAKQAGMLSRVGKLGPLTKDALARQHAIRVVAEGVPTDVRIAKHESLIDGHVPSRAQDPAIRAMRDSTVVKGHQEQIGLNDAAKPYLDESSGTPKLTDPKMQAAYDAMKTVAGNREKLLATLNKLEDSVKQGRISKPGQLFTGDKEFAGGDFRVPTTPKFKNPKSTRFTMGSSNGIGEVKAPGSLTHAYTGAAYRGGAIRNDVVKLMAESGLEAQKYWTLLHVADQLKPIAKDFPTSEHDIPIVTENLPGRPSLAEARARMDDETEKAGGIASLSHGYEGVRKALFPEFTRDENRIANAPISHIDEHGSPVPVPGVKYVDERLLGGLNKPNPLLGLTQYPAGRRAISTVDAINNASKIAILYLKPAYVAPNLLSNLALNFVQQGFAAPVNLARAARLWSRADPELVSKIMASVGEGKISVLDSEAGIASKAAHAAAHFWQKPVDVLPRLASFLHEAARDGVKSDAQLKALFDDPAQAAKLRQVRLRSNDAMIDFGDLSPIEKNIIARVVFFYPWVKGSAKWLGRLPVEHPIQAGAMGTLGPLGQQNQQQLLGTQIPAWAETLIPTGGHGPHGLPNTVNPFTVTPFDQTGSLLESLGAIGSGHPGQAASSIGGMLSPAAGMIGTTASKGPDAALKGLFADLPIITNAEQAGGKNSKTYPYEGTWQQAFARYMLGTGMVPRETSPAELEKSAYLGKHGKTIRVP